MTFFVGLKFWVEGLKARRYKDHINRKGRVDKIEMILWSLETYRYICSKIKSYQILRKFLLLFIFYIF